MAWYSGIVNKAKDIYKKADTKLGGYLPGGQTPQQVSTSKLPSPSAKAPTTPGTRTIQTPSPSKTSPTGYVDKLGQPVSYAPQPSQNILTQPQPSPFQPNQQQGSNQQNIPNITPTANNGNSSNIINPTTNEPYTTTEAPYGLMTLPDGSYRPATQSESGSVSAVTANDIMDLGMLATGILGLGKLAVKGIGSLVVRNTAKIVGERAVLESIGNTAVKAGGPELLASTIPEASGVVTKAATEVVAGTIAVNTATKAGIIKTITNAITTKLPGKSSALGWSISAVLGGVLYSVHGRATTESQATTYLKDSGEQQRKLREQGLFTAAEELHQQDMDVLAGIDTWKGYLPAFGPGIERKIIEDAERILNQNINEYNDYMEQMERQAEIDQMAYEQQQLEEKRRYDEQQLADKRSYDESRLYEQRAYNEQQTALAAQQQAGFDATATEATPGSTLNFGILNTGGDIEYVDINRASEYYFGIPYEKLTPAQRKLLMLGKGTL